MQKYLLSIEFSVESEDQRKDVMKLVGDLMSKVYDKEQSFPVTKLNFEVKEDE